MKSKNRSWFAILALISLLAIAGCAAMENNAGEPLRASGLIEAVEVAISPELSGKVLEVLVDEGDTVATGAELFRLDDRLLQANRQVTAAALAVGEAGVQTAQAALDAAQLQYDLALSAALAVEQDTRLATWEQSKPSEFDQPTWYFSNEERAAATQSEVDAALEELQAAESRLGSVENQVGSTAFLDTETRLAQARIAFLISKQVLDDTSGASDAQALRNAAQDTLDDAKTELEDAQKAYDDELSSDGARDVLEARADETVAREHYNAAVDALRALQTGAQSPAVLTAAQGVVQAEALLAQAQTAVQQAQAQLSFVDAQLEKLVVYAPVDGVLMVRSAQPGETVQAGLPILTIAKLERLTVTVYIPEDRYGAIHIGGTAALSVDSFPGETFAAVVTRISDQAEYTPRNMQTQEERQTTVYAVELSLENPAGKLKPGMPADVVFIP